MRKRIKYITSRSRKLFFFHLNPQRMFESPYAHGLLCLILRLVGSYFITRHAVEAVRIGGGIFIEMFTDFPMLLFKERLEGHGQVLPNPRPELPRLFFSSLCNPKGA